MLPSDQRHLEAARGWLELGEKNHLEANEELERISPLGRAHPNVLELRWEIYAIAKAWDACVDLAKAICTLAPDRATGWLNHAYALHELKRTAEARDCLLGVIEKFPGHGILRYNLACYECQLGDLQAARKWLHEAMDCGDKRQIQEMMLDDPDLEPLRREFGL